MTFLYRHSVCLHMHLHKGICIYIQEMCVCIHTHAHTRPLRKDHVFMSPVHTVHNGALVFKHGSHPPCPLEYLSHVRYSVYSVKWLCNMMSFVSAKSWILNLSSAIFYVLENILQFFFFFYLLGGSEMYAFLSYLFSACCMPGIILGVRNSVAHTTEVPVLMDLAF